MTAIPVALPDTNLAAGRPLRVAHVVRPAQGGMVTHVRTLIANLPQVQSSLAAPGDVLRAIRRDPNSDDHVLPAGALSTRQLIGRGIETGRWARAIGADLLHGHGIRWAMSFWAASRRARLPLVVTIHNLLPPLRPIMRGILRLTLAQADELVAVSDAIAGNVRSLLGQSARVTSIPNGVEASLFDDNPATSGVDTRIRLGLSADAAVALCVARLSPEKNVGRFVEAARLILLGGAVNEARFLVAGDGIEMGALSKAIERAGLGDRVKLLGARDDVPDLLRAASVICLPSRAEGFGLAAVEAMAAARPVVATRVGGVPEVVVDGETGFLVDPEGTAAELASAMSRLLKDGALATALGVAGRSRADRLFRATTMAAATRNVYVKAVSR